MAIVNKVTPETIERLRGKVDFYMLRGILPVARRWPKKPKPPYTALQAEGMAVFSIACANMKRISPDMLLLWQASSEGKRSQWTDVWKGIFMKYWKLTGILPKIALDHEVIEIGNEFKVSWNILEIFIDPLIPEKTYTMTTTLILKSDILLAPKPIYFTLFDDSENRQVAPFILFEKRP